MPARQRARADAAPKTRRAAVARAPLRALDRQEGHQPSAGGGDQHQHDRRREGDGHDGAMAERAGLPRPGIARGRAAAHPQREGQRQDRARGQGRDQREVPGLGEGHAQRDADQVGHRDGQAVEPDRLAVPAGRRDVSWSGSRR